MGIWELIGLIAAIGAVVYAAARYVAPQIAKSIQAFKDNVDEKNKE